MLSSVCDAQNARIISACSDIPGLGEARRKLLLDQFGNVAAIAAARSSDLTALHGIGENLARKILEGLASERKSDAGGEESS